MFGAICTKNWRANVISLLVDEKIHQSSVIFRIVSLKSEFSKANRMDGISLWSRARILSRATVHRIGRLRNAKGSARKTIGTLDQHTRKKRAFFAIHAHGLIGCGTDAARTKRDTALLRGTVQFATRIHPLIGRHN